jgi:hypothetical protein
MTGVCKLFAMRLSKVGRVAKNFKQCWMSNKFSMWSQKGVGGIQEPAGWAQSLSSFVNKAVTEGFTECFKVTNRGLYGISSGRYFRPEQVSVIDTCNFEAQAQLEASIMYILETFDGIRGTLIESSSQAKIFINESEAYQDRVKRFNQPHC